MPSIAPHSHTLSNTPNRKNAPEGFAHIISFAGSVQSTPPHIGQADRLGCTYLWPPPPPPPLVGAPSSQFIGMTRIRALLDLPVQQVGSPSHFRGGRLWRWKTWARLTCSPDCDRLRRCLCSSTSELPRTFGCGGVLMWPAIERPLGAAVGPLPSVWRCWWGGPNTPRACVRASKIAQIRRCAPRHPRVGQQDLGAQCVRRLWRHSQRCDEFRPGGVVMSSHMV